MATKKTATRKKTSPNTFIRTVTSYYTGEVIEENETEIVLVKAAWIDGHGRLQRGRAVP